MCCLPQVDFLPTWLELAGQLRLELSPRHSLCAADLGAAAWPARWRPGSREVSARCWLAEVATLRPNFAPRLARRTAAGVSDPYAAERDGKSFAKVFQPPLLEDPDGFRIGALAENVVTRQGSM